MAWNKSAVNAIKRAEKRHDTEVAKRDERIRKYRQEVSKKAAIANKRLKRLEEAGMTSSPAYEKWMESGGEFFSVRGKTYNEVQAEMARVTAYLDSATSSISGAKKVVQQMVENTGANVQGVDWKDLKNQTANFFEIAGKVEQYLRTVEDRASAIGYQKIWNAINEYTKELDNGLDISKDEIEKVTADIVKAMKVWDSDVKENAPGFSIWTKLDDGLDF